MTLASHIIREEYTDAIWNMFKDKY